MSAHKTILILCLLLTFGLLRAEPEELHRGDIKKIMQQIFDRHVDKKSMSGTILKNSFRTYLEQFDPEGMYLLKSEVDPYLNLSEAEMAIIVEQYRKGDYSAYEKLNELIRRAIVRARGYRAQMEKDAQALFKQALNTPFIFEGEHTASYPATEKELQEKIKKQIVNFLQAEIKHYGEQGVEEHVPQAFALYNRQLVGIENQYANQALKPDQQENLFTLHVLKALAKSLDAHTAFFDPQEAYDMRVRLEKGFEGVGLVFQESPQGIVVTHIIEDSPAAKDGQVKVGDILIELDGKQLNTIPFEEVMNLLRGEKGAPVTLLFKRKVNRLDKSIQVTLKREPIVLKENRVDVSQEQFGNGIIGRITLHSFYQNDLGITSEKDIREAIKKLNQEGNLQGLILDLRENSGGFLSQAVKVAGLFITNGVVVISKYSNGDEKIYRDMDNRRIYNGPLIVLTSKATASAAEIVAQALQDYGVALVVGDERTYGKGTIQSQTVTDEKGGSYFKVTVGEYYTVSGKTPQLLGVKADLVVPGPYSQIQLGEEYLEQRVNGEDKIAATYVDPLKDIDPALRSWYMKYYIPTVQKRQTTWRDLIPQLKTNSSYRLTNNKNYQLFLKRFAQKDALPLKDELAEEEKESSSNFGASDLQLSEAFSILKDMVYLHNQAHRKEYMVGSESVNEQDTVNH